jgi:hypothetical protein
MTSAMSQEAISALVEAARDGSVDDAPALPSRRAGGGGGGGVTPPTQR